MGVPYPRSRFHVLKEIKEGANKGALICRDEITGYIFILHPFDDNHEGAERIELLKKCGNHPHIVEWKGKVELHREQYYLVFEHMEHTLDDFRQPLNEAQVKWFIWQLLSGLDHCHRCGIVLKDLNKSNVLLDKNEMVKIAIFGQVYSSNLDEGFMVMNPPVLPVGEVEDIAAANMWMVGCILLKLMGVQSSAFPNDEMKQILELNSSSFFSAGDLRNQDPLATVANREESYTMCLAKNLENLPQYTVPLLKRLFAQHPKDRGTPKSHLDSEFFTQNSHWDPSNPPKFPLMQRRRDTEKKVCKRWPRMAIHGCGTCFR